MASSLARETPVRDKLSAPIIPPRGPSGAAFGGSPGSLDVFGGRSTSGVVFQAQSSVAAPTRRGPSARNLTIWCRASPDTGANDLTVMPGSEPPPDASGTRARPVPGTEDPCASNRVSSRTGGSPGAPSVAGHTRYRSARASLRKGRAGLCAQLERGCVRRPAHAEVATPGAPGHSLARRDAMLYSGTHPGEWRNWQTR